MNALDFKCPVCQAGPGSACYAVVLSTCTTVRVDPPHDARQQLAAQGTKEQS